MESIKLVKDLGIFIVPKDYSSSTRLGSFFEENVKNLKYLNPELTDKNFSKVTAKLSAGQILRVKIFQKCFTTGKASEECLEFLKNEKALLAGAQGASLVIKQKRHDLLRDLWHISYDEKNALLKSADGRHKMPVVSIDEYGLKFDLVDFEDNLDRATGHCFLGFFIEPQPVSDGERILEGFGM